MSIYPSVLGFFFPEILRYFGKRNMFELRSQQWVEGAKVITIRSYAVLRCATLCYAVLRHWLGAQGC